MAECRGAGHGGVNIRKGDVVAFVEEGVDFGGECDGLDAPYACAEVGRIVSRSPVRLLNLGVCGADESDDVAFDMFGDGDLWDKAAHLVECFGIRNLADGNIGTGCGAA